MRGKFWSAAMAYMRVDCPFCQGTSITELVVVSLLCWWVIDQDAYRKYYYFLQFPMLIRAVSTSERDNVVLVCYFDVASNSILPVITTWLVSSFNCYTMCIAGWFPLGLFDLCGRDVYGSDLSCITEVIALPGGTWLGNCELVATCGLANPESAAVDHANFVWDICCQSFQVG